MIARASTALVLAALLLPGVARAANATLKGAQDTFAYGDFAEASRISRELLDSHQLASEGDLIEAYRIAGLSSFYLNHADAARQAFVSLLSLSPDYALDPFLVPPAAVAFFDGVKRDNQSPLDLIRAQRKALADQERLADEARKHLFEEQLRRQVEPDRPVLVERVEKRTYALNFFPFGIGEFQEDRPLLGGIFAGTQVVALATAGFAYLEINNLKDPFGHYETTPVNNLALANQVAVAKWIALGVFGAAYAGNIVDSLTHYAGSVSRIEALPQPAQHATPGQPSPAAPSAPAPSTPVALPPSTATPAVAPSSLLLLPWATPTGGGLALSFAF